MYSMNKRYHGTNKEAIAYDVFGFPHESVHTAGEVLRWFDKNNLEYTGSFAPLRFRDYFYAYSLPEYHSFKKTFSGFPIVQFISYLMNKVSSAYRFFVKEDDTVTLHNIGWSDKNPFEYMSTPDMLLPKYGK